MALHHYFKISSKLPNPNGPLSESIPSQVIKEANEIVKQSTQNGSTKLSRGTYLKFTPTQQAQAAKYAIENGNQAAIHRYSKEFCTEIKESIPSTWKSKYLNEIKEHHKARAYDKSGEIVVSSLPSKKRGRPLLLGDELDKQVQSYVRATHDGKGAVTTTVVLAAGEAIARHHNKSLSNENGAPIKLTRYWARSLLERMDFVKRKATTAAKIEPSHFDELKEQYLLDIKAVVEMEKVPSELYLTGTTLG